MLDDGIVREGFLEANPEAYDFRAVDKGALSFCINHKIEAFSILLGILTVLNPKVD